jgi:glyoxylase-like metal-dependent hydrolase (beta-lactamase superfamily II)
MSRRSPVSSSPTAALAARFEWSCSASATSLRRDQPWGGRVLINSGFDVTVPLVRKSVETFGYRMADIRVLLASHARSDPVAGHARTKELTGATVCVMRGDDAVIASGGIGLCL